MLRAPHMGHPKDTGKGPSQVAVALCDKCVWDLLNLLHLLRMVRVYEHADAGLLAQGMLE